MSYATNKCDICLNKDICKHYQYFRDNFEIVVEVKDCNKVRYNQTFSTNSATPLKGHEIGSGVMTIPAPTVPTPWEPFKDRTSAINKDANSNIFLGKQPREYPDLKKIPDPLNPVTATFATNITPVEVSKGICDRCKQEVSTIDIDNCVECGRPVCKDCSVTTINDAGKPECTCEKCWSGAPDPDPNNPEEVKITYGEEVKEWNLEDFEAKEEVKEEKEDESGDGKQVEDRKSTRKSKKK